MTLTAATLFSGIGSPETAMPEWQWPWHAEIEKFPNAVMAAHHPHSANLGDVSADDFAERAAAIARPNVLIFGSPCQSYSAAGKRLGLDDPRGNLALVALGIIDRLKPDWFTFENVPGLLSSSEGRDFGIFLRTVDELGYFGAWASLDAQWFGVAQRRKRLFFVGNSRDWRHSAAVLFEPESLCGHSPPRRQTGQNASLPVTSCVDRGGSHREAHGNNLIANPLGSKKDGGWRGDLDNDTFVTSDVVSQPLLAKANSSHRTDAESYVAHYLNAGGMGRIDYETETFVTHALRADGFDASEDGTGRGTPLIAFSSKDYGADASTLAPTLRAMGHDGSHANAGGQVAIVASPLCAGYSKGAGHNDGKKGSPQNLIVGSSVRRLTPRECERLQGFPDDYTFISYCGKPAADGPRYKALGNSMAVPVMRWILSRIEQVHTQ